MRWCPHHTRSLDFALEQSTQKHAKQISGQIRVETWRHYPRVKHIPHRREGRGKQRRMFFVSTFRPETSEICARDPRSTKVPHGFKRKRGWRVGTQYRRRRRRRRMKIASCGLIDFVPSETARLRGQVSRPTTDEPSLCWGSGRTGAGTPLGPGLVRRSPRGGSGWLDKLTISGEHKSDVGALGNLRLKFWS